MMPVTAWPGRRAPQCARGGYSGSGRGGGRDQLRLGSRSHCHGTRYSGCSAAATRSPYQPEDSANLPPAGPVTAPVAAATPAVSRAGSHTAGWHVTGGKVGPGHDSKGILISSFRSHAVTVPECQSLSGLANRMYLVCGYPGTRRRFCFKHLHRCLFQLSLSLKQLDSESVPVTVKQPETHRVP
eukprot:1502558-Rhodomonas_salina.3